jgi:hypothetical protein
MGAVFCYVSMIDFLTSVKLRSYILCEIVESSILP